MNSWVDVEPDLRMGPASSMFSPGGAATPRPCARYFPLERQLRSRVRLFIDAIADWLNKRAGGYVAPV